MTPIEQALIFLFCLFFSFMLFLTLKRKDPDYYRTYPSEYVEETGIFTEEEWRLLTDAQKEAVWWDLEENHDVK